MQLFKAFLFVFFIFSLSHDMRAGFAQLPYQQRAIFGQTKFVQPRQSNRNYSIYRKVYGPLTPQEHKIIYPIDLKYSFPSCLAHGVYTKDEQKKIQEEIDQQLPNSGIKAHYISRTMYDLMIMHNLVQERRNKSQLGGLIDENECVLKEYIRRAMCMPQFVKINLNPDAQAAHYEVNRYIDELLSKRNISDPLEHDYKKILIDPKFLKMVTDYYIDNLDTKSSSWARQPLTVHAELFARFLQEEHKAEPEGKFLLYRGTNNVPDPYCPSLTPVSHSFGVSPLSGYFDVGRFGARAYDYLLYRQKGYLLPIDKASYVNGEIGSMFHIAPYLPIVSFVGAGEHFHGRSKVPSGYMNGIAHTAVTPECYRLPEKEPRTLIQRLLGYVKRGTGYRTSCEQKEIYANIFKYIENHHMPINVSQQSVGRLD